MSESSEVDHLAYRAAWAARLWGSVAGMLAAWS